MNKSEPNDFDEESIERILSEGTFEESLNALEAVVEQLERGRATIEQTVGWYELGLKLSLRCSDLLEQAELRVSTLETMYGPAERDRMLWGEDVD